MAEIRAARLDDIPQLVKWGEEFWKGTYFWQERNMPYDAETVEELCEMLIKEQHGHISVCTDDDGDVRGFALAFNYQFVFNKNVPMMCELAWYVDPTFREKGIGSKLLERVELVARFRGCKFMTMVSMKHSMDVGPLYEKHGYTQTESTYVKEL